MGQRLSPIEMIGRLVGFDTTSRNSNLALIEYVADYLRGHGIAASILLSPDGQKANLHAILGPDRPGGIVLSGHTDVVPVDGQAWDSDPFTVVERNGSLFGRGTADMKSFIAVALALVPEFLAAGALRIPIHFALTYDEEVGCAGVHGLVPKLALPATHPAVCIVGEPTEMRVVNAHKGIRVVITTVRGLDAHSSATHIGVNAIMHAAELIGFLKRIAEELKGRAQPNSRFDPPYTTVSVGTISGGTALNIIARECHFVWEHRIVPGSDEDEVLGRFRDFAEHEVLPRMRRVHPGSEIVIEEMAKVRPLVPLEGSPAESLVLALTRSNQTYAVSYGTEAGIIQSDADVPTVVCGPGSIMQAHKPNEFIALSEVRACEAFMRRLYEYCRA